MRSFPHVAWASAIVLAMAAQQEVRADTIEDGPIRVSPQRLTLGALPYGGPESPVMAGEVKIDGLFGGALEAIDLSHAPGVHLLDRREVDEKTILRFGINVSQFTEGEPYGIFVKRTIRLETTSPDQPQILIPVVGWTALNKTSHNFHNYFFSGNERWQGIWATPNIAGSVLAPLLLLILGWAAALFSVRSSGCRWLKASVGCPLFGLFGALLALLGATYSRGAWIAFLAGSLVLVLSSARLRPFAFGGLLIFALIVLLLPSGLKRVDSYAQIQEDPSISHRLELWTGALQMMGDHPEGAGAGQFAPIFERDYQRFTHVALNTTAVSDYLTIGSERGVLFLSVILGSLLLILLFSLRDAWTHDNPWQLTLSAALFAILVASAFSTLWFVPDYQGLLGLILIGLMICLLIQNWSNSERNLMRIVAQEGIFVFSCFLVLEAMALSSLLLQPTQSSDISMTDSQGNILSVHRIDPRWHKPKGIVVYFPGERDSLSLLSHSTLRPLSALGWLVYTSKSDFETNPDFVAIAGATHPGLPVFVAGQKEGGHMAWLAATHLSKPVIRAGAGLDFLTMDLAPTRGGASLQTPFLVFHLLYDDQVSANAAIRASRHNAFSGLPLTVRLSLEEPAAFSEGSKEWVQAIDRYFSERIAL